jgi:hypothetical protein
LSVVSVVVLSVVSVVVVVLVEKGGNWWYCDVK